MPIEVGTYVKDEWRDLGLVLSAQGGLSDRMGNMPRIFDTANPGNATVGDPDLGAPNRKCTPTGPGIGMGGEPGQPGINCKPLGNVLIIQENNNLPLIPDDNAKGGSITMDFPDAGGKSVHEIGLLDIDEPATVVVTSDSVGEKVINVPNLGDNSYQVVTIHTANVRSVKVLLTGSGAVTHIKLGCCHLS